MTSTSLTEVTSDPPAADRTQIVQHARAISTLRFVTYLALVTTACIAWYLKKFMISTPLTGMSGVLLRSKSELLEPVRMKLLLPSVVIAIVVIGALGFLIEWSTPFVSSLLTKEQFDAIAVHPVSIGLGWLLLVYAGASTWRRQLETRDAGK